MCWTWKRIMSGMISKLLLKFRSNIDWPECFSTDSNCFYWTPFPGNLFSHASCLTVAREVCLRPGHGAGLWGEVNCCANVILAVFSLSSPGCSFGLPLFRPPGSQDTHIFSNSERSAFKIAQPLMHYVVFSWKPKSLSQCFYVGVHGSDARNVRFLYSLRNMG